MTFTEHSKDSYTTFNNLVDGRTVGFICHGLSLELFPESLNWLDFCWGSLNQYWIAENVLKKRLDFVVWYSGLYKNFWHDGVILRDAPRRKQNTLFEFLTFCDEAKVDRVILFGADGYSEKEAYHGGIQPDIYMNHKEDTKKFNKHILTTHTEILNCSPNSKYELTEITYEDLWNIV